MNTPSVIRHCREAASSFATKWRSSFVVAAVLCALAQSAAAAPAAFAYQGVVLEENGSIPANKNQSVAFRLYTQAEGGTPVWGRTVMVLLDSEGLFNTELSDAAGTPIEGVVGSGLASILAANAGASLYIGVTIGNTSGEIAPRQTLLPVPYAMVAADIATASGDLEVAGRLSSVSSDTAGLLSAGSLSVSGAASVGGDLAVSGTVSGYGVAPVGCIILWSGAQNNIPEGWHLCDGTQGTPDLRDRFVVGAGRDYRVGDKGGEKEHTLNTSEMPTHRHEYVGDDQLAGIEPGCSTALRRTSTGYDAASSLGSSWYSHVYATSSVGSNEPHENRPPYYALCFIMRVR
ncbi:MAG: hypothetical protein IJV65_10495 [Kiritimatiellae bacterium]|nr:hypothetical protein [Kiritimatiellia bacterium]